MLNAGNRTHLLISLRTWSPAQARSLAVQLDAFLDDLITMPEARFLTQAQLDGMLRDVLTRHLAKLERVAAAAKLAPGFDRRQAEQDDRRTAWVYRLLDAHGPNAHVADSDRDAILADGFDGRDLKFIIDHLARLQDNGLVPTKPHILRPLLAAQNAEPTAMNLAQAQQVYFRGMRLALQQTAARYRAQPIHDEAFVVGLMQAEAGSARCSRRRRRAPRIGRSEASTTASAEPHVAVSAGPAAPPEPAPFDDRISILGDRLLSLFPFATGWLGENHFAVLPTACYGGVLLAAAIAYWILQQVIIRAQGPGSALQRAIGGDWKGKLSPLLYLCGIGLAAWLPPLAQALYVLVALLWLVPDRRIERALSVHGH